ncbi:ABC transporter permease [Kroppenstedtia eburnea]|uniref:Transport permease protein n=1 Tax=Kroppenstedtia eburnea TaxID=714067 RepID=A0A1N7LNF7_9BACL|nr:ABC transporter permease [Kroppenstedtia eburnea]QKI81238.1 ABC transporter permease [Kroppenstedtia eburnea]SIS75368.1 ABC-2 type transport system permease protein [Kroppenstedtia eburnea]
MQALWMHTRMEVKLLFREVIAVFFTFLLPAVAFVIMGNIFGEEVYSTGDYFETYIPAMIGIVIFATCFFAIGMQVVIDREKGVYKRLKGTPINPAFVMSALVIKGFIVFVGTFEIVVLVKFVFDVDVSSTLVQFLVAVSWSTLSFLGMGFLLASVARRMQSALAISLLLFYPMMFLSGAFFPLDMMSGFWRDLTLLNPLFYAIEMMQLGWKGGHLFTRDGWIDTLVLGGIFVVSTGFGFKYFRWESH